jgi:hypothetical protein
MKQMRPIEQIAELIVKQWDEHDKFREHETVLFNNGVEPDEVAVARALIEALEELEAFRRCDYIG